MVRASLRVDTKAVRKLVRKSPQSIERWARKAFAQHGLVFKREMGARFGGKLIDGRNPRPAGGRLGSRSGALEGSIGFTVTGSNLRNLKLIFHVGNRETIKYAVTQEDGMTIFGKPWLAVPLPPNLTGTGRSRIERPLLVKGKPGWFIAPSKSGFVIGKLGSDGTPEWHWALVRSVKIPPRLGFEKTVNSKKLQKDRMTRLRNAVGRGIQEAAGRG